MVNDMCIIGMGISGVACARWALAENIDTVILEKNPSFGGCWLEKSYPNVYLQTSKHSYAYSDMKMDDKVGLYPTRKDVLGYMEKYSKKYGLLKIVQFSCEVKSLHWDVSQKKWIIKYFNYNQKREVTIKKDAIAICTGMYTTPNIPDIPGINDTQIVVKHSINWGYLNPGTQEDFTNKHVVVIGNGPTGCDLACLAVENKAKSVTILYRSPRWILQRKIGIFSIHRVLNRASLAFGRYMPKKLLLLILYFMIFIPFYSAGFQLDLKLPSNIITRKNVCLNEKLFHLVHQKKIKYRQCKNIELHSKYLFFESRDKFTSGRKLRLKPDLVVLATGYKTEIKPIGMKSIPYLYKRIIPPQLPNCGFIGFAATFNWAQVSDLQSRWFIHYLKKKIKLPSEQRMLLHIYKKKREFENYPYDYHDLSYLAYKYSDDLAKDMGIPSKYSKLNPLYWYGITNDEWEDKRYE